MNYRPKDDIVGDTGTDNHSVAIEAGVTPCLLTAPAGISTLDWPSKRIRRVSPLIGMRAGILNQYPATARNVTRLPDRRPELPDDDIFEFVATGTDPAYGTTELASEFEYSQAGMHKRLNQLQMSGRRRRPAPTA